MANHNQYATEIARLHKTAAGSRPKAVKVRHHAETIRFHVDEPNHLPSTAVSDLRKHLTQLEKRANEIESRLPAHGLGKKTNAH